MTPEQPRDLGSADGGSTLASIGESDLLAQITPELPTGPGVLVGPGDDTALVTVASGAVLTTTDAMVLGRDWLDEWSSGADVGAKAVAQNAADIAAMGGVCTGMLVTLVAAEDTPLEWARDFHQGVAYACRDAGIPVIGGDLSSAPPGQRMVSITALGELVDGHGPVLRSGAQPGDVVAVSGPLGRAAAGLILLQEGRDGEAVGWQRRPRPRYADGPDAARHGATAMLDVSDGLVRDAGRIAAASTVAIALEGDRLRPFARALAPQVGARAQECVLTGGEEHVLLATFAPGGVPDGWTVVGRVEPGSGVLLDGQPQSGGGWDHFGG